MVYRSLYREWRPLTFSQVVGQDHITRTLKNALEKGKVAHAYLFAGPRGTGKTSTAKILARALNCRGEERDGVEPCNRCDSCQSITNGTSLDVLEIDAASNRGVDEIRALRDQVNFVPAREEFKVYIIDEVHMLTMEAFNALLKTLEEPPERVFFILATTEPHKLPATIISRCQRFDFHLIGREDSLARLRQIAEAEGIETEEQALEALVSQAGGAMRDAIGLLEQCLTFTENTLTVDTVRSLLGLPDPEQIETFIQAVKNADVAGGMELLQQLSDRGRSLHQFVVGLLAAVRDRLILAKGQERDLYLAVAESFTLLSREIRQSDQPRLQLELAFLQLVGRQDAMQRLESRITALEQALQALPAGNLPASIHPSSATPTQPPEVIAKEGGKKQVRLSKKVPQPSAAEPVPAGPDINYLKKNWKEILARVRRIKPQSYAWLMEGEPAGVDGKVLVIEFGPGYNFHCENVAKPEHRQVIETVLREYTGTGLKIKPSLVGGNSVSDPNPAAGEKHASPAPGAELEDARQIFGGRVLNIDHNKAGGE